MSETLDITSLKLEQKNAAINNLKISRMKAKLLKKNKNIKQVIFDNNKEKYIFTTNEGKVFITEHETKEDDVLKKVDTNEILTDDTAILSETNFKNVINETGEKVLKSTYKNKYGYVFTGNGGCYAVSAGNFYDLSDNNIKRINPYNIRGWGDLYWDKRFISQPSYYGGAASTVAPTVPAHNYSDFTQQYKTNPAFYKKRNIPTPINDDKGFCFEKTGISDNKSIASFYNDECFNTTVYSKNYFKKPFVNLRIPYIISNSNKAMRTYKNNDEIVVISAYDNPDSNVFVNPSHENNATQEIKTLYNGTVTLMYGYQKPNNRALSNELSIEYTRTLTPKYQTTYPALPQKTNNREFVYKNHIGYPGRIIENKPYKISLPAGITNIINIQTQNSRYGTRFNALLNQADNKFIGLLPDDITMGTWTNRKDFENKTQANQLVTIREWNTSNVNFSDPNRNLDSVWKDDE